MGPKIILASGSLIRRELMANAGIEFDVITKAVDEAAIKSSLLNEGVSVSCLLYTSPSPRDRTRSRMPSSA